MEWVLYIYGFYILECLVSYFCVYFNFLAEIKEYICTAPDISAYAIHPNLRPWRNDLQDGSNNTLRAYSE